MHTERIFSLVRKATPLRSHVMRLLAAGFFSQVQSRHLLAGGSDCRKITRRQLCEMNVPIRARSVKGIRKKGKNGQASKQLSFSSWVNSRISNLKEEQPSGKLGPREAYRQHMKHLREDLMDMEKKTVAQLVASSSRTLEARRSEYVYMTGNKLFNTSCYDTPVNVEVLHSIITDELGEGACSGKQIGLTEQLAPLRSTFGKSSVVEDHGLK